MTRLPVRLRPNRALKAFLGEEKLVNFEPAVLIQRRINSVSQDAIEEMP